MNYKGRNGAEGAPASFIITPSYFTLFQRVHGGLLGGEEDDVVVVSGRGQIGGAGGEGGLAHAARAINERAPAGGVGMEVREELGEFGIATKEALDGGEIRAGR